MNGISLEPIGWGIASFAMVVAVYVGTCSASLDEKAKAEANKEIAIEMARQGLQQCQVERGLGYVTLWRKECGSEAK